MKRYGLFSNGPLETTPQLHPAATVEYLALRGSDERLQQQGSAERRAARIELYHKAYFEHAFVQLAAKVSRNG
ncbi:hypothetical protein ACIGPN_28800 [Streptomyces afghaniensis]|uniref:hypothetical protein n=1 Tax=Streptomyces afghaniensis TaxID=66865 RepID=UPI0037D5D9C0